MQRSVVWWCSIFVIAAASTALAGCLEGASEMDGAAPWSEAQTEQALAGYQVVTGETQVSALVTKQLSVACPKGTKALGAGWAVLDNTSAILDGMASYFEPSFDGSSWLVNARNTSAFAAEWKLRVDVVCGSASLAGYEVVASETAVTTVNTKQLLPTCPKGKRALGAGWGVLDSASAILYGEALAFSPEYDGSGWLIEARSNAAFSAWKLHSRLICANEAALGGYEVVLVETAVSAASSKQLGVSCPGGKTSTAFGWSVLDSTSAILDGRATLAGRNGAGWVANATKLSSFAATWKLRLQAVCTL